MASAAVVFLLADGTSLLVPEVDLRHVYDELWSYSDRAGAISTAVLLIEEARKQDRYRLPVELTPQQSNALSQAVARFANLS